jgi:ornithine carbamoyltransferase
MNLKYRNFLKLLDFSKEEIFYLLKLAAFLKNSKKSGSEKQLLKGKNIALIFEKSSTRTRSAFEVACFDQGANVTYLGPKDSQTGYKESIKDTARVLGRIYDGIEYRGFSQNIVEELGRYAGVPVWNGLTDEFHPTQVLADLLTIEEHIDKPLSQVKVCYLGHACNNMANSLMVGASLTGMDFRIAAPLKYQPEKKLQESCHEIANLSGAKILISEDVNSTVRDCDFLYTDVWVSMGEPSELWGKRINLLLPYQVNMETINMTKNPKVKFLHCLPAFHNRNTLIGEEIFQKFGLTAMEVTEDVFESDASLVFEQSENRLHTIKAVMVATLSEVNPLT